RLFLLFRCPRATSTALVASRSLFSRSAAACPPFPIVGGLRLSSKRSLPMAVARPLRFVSEAIGAASARAPLASSLPAPKPSRHEALALQPLLLEPRQQLPLVPL